MQMCDEQYMCWRDGDSFIENSVFLSAALLAKGQKVAACDEISETTEPQMTFPQPTSNLGRFCHVTTIKKKGNQDR